MNFETEIIKRVATDEVITNADRIEKTIKDFLQLKCEELGTNNPSMRYLVRDLATGFALDEESVRKCTVEEILILIGYEPAAPWFEIPENDKWFYDKDPDKRYFSAGNSFLMGNALLKAYGQNNVIKQLLSIDHWTFFKYLANQLSAGCLPTPQENVRKAGMRLNHIYAQGKGYIQRYKNAELNEMYTMGEYIADINRLGASCWMCGTESADEYVEKVVQAYLIMNRLFMDCIRMMLIKSDRSRFKSILDRCSGVSGGYEQERYEELCFYGCYE